MVIIFIFVVYIKLLSRMGNAHIISRHGKMKQHYSLLQRMLVLLVMLNGALAAGAVILRDFTIDGIVYSINDSDPSTVSLKRWNSIIFNANPIENWTIPNQVVFEGTIYPVTKLAAKCLKNFKHFNSMVSIPDGVTSIGDNAFEGSNLKNVYGGKNVKKLGNEAFKDCAELKVMAVANNLTTIGVRCFSGCTSLTSSPFSGGLLTAIGDEAFAGCTALPTEISISHSVETLGDGAFKGCNQLKSVIMGGKPLVSGTTAPSPFIGCIGLKRVVISQVMTDLSFSASADQVKTKKQNFLRIADGVYPPVLVRKGDETACAALLGGDGVQGYKEILPYTLQLANQTYNGYCQVIGFDVEKMKANDAYGVDNVYAFTRIENDKVYFNAVKKVEPGLPYVVKRKDDDCRAFVCEEGASVDAYTGLVVTDTPFKGTFMPVSTFFVHYNLNNDGGFYKDTTSKVLSWNVYLLHDSDKDYLESVYDDTVTSISHVSATPSSHLSPWYDLQGRPVSHPQPGTVYVKDGKKVVR